MYFDEDIVLDLRLNTLNDFVDYFVIVESIFTHKGEKRELKFNHEKFEKFKDKIIYLVYERDQPDKIEKNEKMMKKDNRKYIINAFKRKWSKKLYFKRIKIMQMIMTGF